MKISKKIFILASVLLASCQNQSNVLTFSTPSPTIVFNTNNQTVAVNVITQDSRSSREIANYTKNGNIVRLTSLPEVTLMFQQVMQQSLNAKGFQIVQGAAHANVITNVHTFFATVEQGNLRYKVNAQVGVEVIVQGSKGNFNKQFSMSRGYEGVFGASNNEIKKLLELAYSDVVNAIYRDNEITNAIHKFK